MWDDRYVEEVSCVRDSRDKCAYDGRENQELAHRRVSKARGYHLKLEIFLVSIVGFS